MIDDYYKQWDVCIAEVPFEDIKSKKIRPVLVLEDGIKVISCFKITSKHPRRGEYVIKKWKEAGLDKQTVVRVGKLLELGKCSIIKKIGHIHPIDIIGVQKAIIDFASK